jgi:sugar phosphate isomerase/epimerase
MKSILRLALIPLLALAASVAPAAEKPAGTGPSFKGPVGLQLYSLRGQFTAKGVPPTLDQVKGYGIHLVELAGTYNLPPEQFKALLDERGIKAVSAHFPYDRYKKEPEAVAREAKALGVEYAGCAWINHKPPFNEAAARDAIAVFNEAGRVLAGHGIRFFYHCHGYEFHPHGNGTLMDLLIKETDPKHVRFQMDVLWVVYPGQDPVKWLEKYPGRWELMHLKDLKQGVPTGDLSGKTAVENDVVLGTGQMDWPAILRAARKSGVKWYFLEDESPWSGDQIPQSLRFLEQVKF